MGQAATASRIIHGLGFDSDKGVLWLPAKGLRSEDLSYSTGALRIVFGDDTMILDSIGIQKLLPHRYPFLMIDGIHSVDRGKSIVGVKNVSINEGYFQGHFPGQPVMPGVLIIESMAQTGGVLLMMEIPDREKKLLYFAAMDSARFRKPVVPGDQMMIHVDVLNNRGDFWKMRGVARVNGEDVAEATLMCKMIDRDAAPEQK